MMKDEDEEHSAKTEKAIKRINKTSEKLVNLMKAMELIKQCKTKHILNNIRKCVYKMEVIVNESKVKIRNLIKLNNEIRN